MPTAYLRQLIRHHVGEPAEIVGLIDKPMTTTITGLEMFHKLLDEAQAGDNVGALLRGINRTEPNDALRLGDSQDGRLPNQP